ncbi:MAG TPA: translation initiation factor IF-2 [Steroidobacteraceae bacterium]|nr:translation initiation factor IF-2 [Steroidobacteraceae bacterium]
MAEVTVTQFADVLKVPVDRLLVQLEQAGITVSGADDMISDEAKMELLTHLRRSHGSVTDDASPRKITLKRKTQSELKLASPQGRARTVNVEVRVKRTYVKRDVLEEQNRAHNEQVDQKRREIEALQQVEAEKAETERREQQRLDEENRRRVEEEQQRARQVEESRRAVELREREDTERDKTRRPIESQRPQEPAAKVETKPAKVEHKPEHRKPEAGGTRYGRQELHVAGDAGARFRKKTKHRMRGRPVTPDGEQKHGFEMPTAPVRREVAIGETVTVSELAQRMAVKATEVIRTLMGLGVMATINQSLDQDTAVMVIEEMGHESHIVKDNEIEEDIQGSTEQVEELPRPPVVTVMGHVDHGKTSLLDYIRRTKVAAGEAGGITQHIGAYHVETPRGMVTFLDTPGHAAFTAMRARGAKATDVVVLVVAADDGVMPQTIEAIQHARAAGVPIVVAVNKIDKPDADPERVRTELTKHEVVSEEWGGSDIFRHVSAKAGTGIDELLEAILLQAEVLELKAPREGLASGIVIESSVEKGRGAVATVLVKRGTLCLGDPILAGQQFGRVRAMFDETGKAVKEALPSMPVVVLGLTGAPNAGDDLLVVESDRKAREVAQHRQSRHRDVRVAGRMSATAEDVFTQMEEAKTSVIPVLVKTDVQGSAEALRDALSKLSTDEVAVKVLGANVGGITASDIQLAAASKAQVIGFNVRADASARDAMKETGLQVRYYSIIYEAIDDIKAMMSGMLSPEIKEQILGTAQVRDVFRSSKFGVVAGCLIMEGTVKRNNPIRVLRDSVVIFEGALESLRRFKDDVNEVRAGTECGIGVKDYQDVRVGDQIECFSRVEVARTI